MITVGVIRGGIGDEFEQSIATGGVVISYLLEHEQLKSQYKPIDILVDRAGAWHMSGIPVTPEKVYQSVDVIFNTLHSPYDHLLAKQEFTRLGIKTPTHMLFEAYLEDLDGPRETYPARKAKEVFNKIPPPWRAFPLTKGTSMGIHVCKTLPELARAFAVGMNERVSVVVEELIEGAATSVSVVNNFRNQSTYVFLCTDNLSSRHKREVEELAKRIHNEFHIENYSQSHFVVHPRRGIYATHVMISPALHLTSHLHEHIASVGVTTAEFIEHMMLH
jgi:D-alanine-D-alanine ligase-like ATP-grasp enzyme